MKTKLSTKEARTETIGDVEFLETTVLGSEQLEFLKITEALSTDRVLIVNCQVIKLSSLTAGFPSLTRKIQWKRKERTPKNPTKNTWYVTTRIYSALTNSSKSIRIEILSQKLFVLQSPNYLSTNTYLFLEAVQILFRAQGGD